jgi:hypothetical protein
MIDRDGQHDLVMKTAATSNQIRLLDVTDGPLLDWILTSGLTLEEIDLIQAPMPMPPPKAPEPQARVAIDAELARGYASTEAKLIKRRNAGLEVAADRLMEHPALARALLGGVS